MSVTDTQSKAGVAFANKYILAAIKSDAPRLFENAAERALQTPAHQAQVKELVDGIINAAAAPPAAGTGPQPR